jgi:nicotinamide mononucleotide transporter
MSFHEILENIADAAANTSALEFAAVICAVIYVILAAKENILCWLFGIISSFIYVYICFQTNLFLETGLQIFYVLMGFYGWWQWLRNKGTQQHAPVIEWKIASHLIMIIAGAAGGAILGFIFAKYTTAAQPYLDAFISSYSLIATWMVTKKILENWVYWIIIDAASVILYGNRGLYLSSALFILYTILAVYGFIAWRKELKALHA